MRLLIESVAYATFICMLFCSTALSQTQASGLFPLDIIDVSADANPSTVKLWMQHLKGSGVRGRSFIGPIPGNGTIDRKHQNGKRDTIIFVPSQYDNKKPTDVLVWLHGHVGFNKFKTRILRHLDKLYNRGLNPVVIAIEQPWSYWTSTRTSRNGTGPFRRPGEFERWMDTVLEILKRYDVPVEQLSSRNITLYGHSAGGSGIMSMARSGALGIMKPGKIVFSDSTYGRWFDVVYREYLAANPETEVFVLTQRHGPPWRSMMRFLGSNKNVSENIHHIPLRWTHKKIGDNCLLYPGKPF